MTGLVTASYTSKGNQTSPLEIPLIPTNPIVSITVLNASYPAALYPGAIVTVGTAQPYTTYTSNGVQWYLSTPTSNLIDPGSYPGRLSSLRQPSIARSMLIALKANIIAAGDTVTSFELSALEDPLERLMRSTAFAKLKELWIPLGTSALTGAMIKLIGSSTKVMTAVNMVAGDFTTTTGVKGDAVSKYINTQFNPTTAGVTATDWGFGVFSVNPVGATLNGCLGGSISDAGNYVAYNGTAKLNNLTANPYGINPAASGPDGGLNAVQLTASRIQSFFGGYQKGDNSNAGQALMNANITLLSINAAFFSAQYIGGYAAWSPGLTATEMRELALFFNQANHNLLRSAWAPTLVMVGDSIGAGATLGSPTTQRYSALLSASYGLTENNQATSGWAMSHTSTVNGANGDWNTQRPYTGSTQAGIIMLVGLGTNDLLFKGGVVNFLTDYETFLLNQFATGIDPSQIIIINIPASPNVYGADMITMNTGLLALAGKYGCGYADVYSVVASNVGNFPDGLHPNQASHLVMANTVMNAIAASKHGAVIRRLPWN